MLSVVHIVCHLLIFKEAPKKQRLSSALSMQSYPADIIDRSCGFGKPGKVVEICKITSRGPGNILKCREKALKSWKFSQSDILSFSLLISNFHVFFIANLFLILLLKCYVRCQEESHENFSFCRGKVMEIDSLESVATLQYINILFTVLCCGYSKLNIVTKITFRASAG